MRTLISLFLFFLSIGLALAESPVSSYASPLALDRLQSEQTAALALDPAAAKISCPTCIKLANATLSYLGNHNLTALGNLLKKTICHDSQSQSSLATPQYSKLCDKLVDAIIKALPKFAHTQPLSDPHSLCTFISACQVPCCSDSLLPSQIHIAWTGNLSAMTVQWTVLKTTPNPTVEFRLAGSGSAWSTAAASPSSYTAMGWIGVVYTGVMSPLLANNGYEYRVGDAQLNIWSNIMQFRTLNDSQLLPVRLALIGDVGAPRMVDNPNSNLTLAHLRNLTFTGAIDGIIHDGDISYSDGAEALWDEYLNAIQPFASTIPYMTIDGNHELYSNFISYRTRFAMPIPASNQTNQRSISMAEFESTWTELESEEHFALLKQLIESSQSNNPLTASLDPLAQLKRMVMPRDTMFYSFDLGAAHLIAIDAESSLDLPYVSDAQVHWLEQDLQQHAKARAAAAASGSGPTWLIVYMHRPLYCANHYRDCELFSDYLRLRLEKLFYTYGVDIVFQAHVHNYQRYYPTYGGKQDPKGPIYIINGAGGSREGYANSWVNPPPSTVAFREIKTSLESVGLDSVGLFGYGQLEYDQHTLTWNYYANCKTNLEKNGMDAAPILLDSVTLSR